MDSLLRNGARWIPGITLVVVDEVHLINSRDRGPTLEMVIAKMRSKNPGMQLIGLSATIGNPKMLAGWLDAELVTSSWRPVDLRQGVFYDNKIQFEEGTRPIKQVSKNYDDLNLCLDTIADGGTMPCLCLLAEERRGICKTGGRRDKERGTRHLPRAPTACWLYHPTEMIRTLAACVAKGAAFHHAGLDRNNGPSWKRRSAKAGSSASLQPRPWPLGLNLPAPQGNHPRLSPVLGRRGDTADPGQRGPADGRGRAGRPGSTRTAGPC